MLIVLICVISAGQLIAQDLTAEQIVANYLKAIGQDNLMTKETMKITGRMTVQGMEFQLLGYEKKPAKERQEIIVQGMKLIMVIDGKTGWKINPMMGITDPQDLTPEDITDNTRQERNDPSGTWDSPMMSWKTDGTKIELAGMEDVDKSAAYNLKFTFSDKNVINYLVDTKSFLIVRSKSTQSVQGKSYEQEIRFGAYKDFDGVRIPEKVEVYLDGVLGQTAYVESCEFNIPIDDSLFRKPVKSQ